MSACDACGKEISPYAQPHAVTVIAAATEEASLSQYTVMCCDSCQRAAEYAAQRALAYIARSAGRPTPWASA